MDDPLRMIRGLRFCITKGFTIDDELWNCMLEPGLLMKVRGCSFSRKNQRRGY